MDELDNVDRDSNAASLEEDEIGLVDVLALFRTLISEKRFIFWTSFGVFVCASIVAFTLPFSYTSTASFIPPSGSSSSSSLNALVAGQLSSLGAGNFLGGGGNTVELYIGILKSRSVAEKLVRHFDLVRVYHVKKESQAENILASVTTIVADPKSSIVTLSVANKSPGFAHDLVAAYMETLREINGRVALGQSSQRRLFFGQQLAKEKDDLEDAEVELKKTEEQSGLISPSGQTTVQIETIAQTRAQIALRRVQLAALRESSTDQNPEVIRLRSEISDLQGQLGQLQNGHGTGSSAVISTSKVPELQLDYVRKEREVKYHEALFEILSRQYESARLDEARDAPLLQVLDPASYPDAKSAPKRSLIVLGGLIFGFIASCAWVLLREPFRAFRASLAAGEAA